MVENDKNKKSKIVDCNHKLLDKHAIFLTIPLKLYNATKAAERFNSMSSNSDQKMFAVKLVSEHKSKEKNYMVARKLCIGDRINFIDYPKE